MFEELWGSSIVSDSLDSLLHHQFQEQHQEADAAGGHEYVKQTPYVGQS